jgi:hypothetical protein
LPAGLGDESGVGIAIFENVPVEKHCGSKDELPEHGSQGDNQEGQRRSVATVKGMAGGWRTFGWLAEIRGVLRGRGQSHEKDIVSKKLAQQ